MNCLPLWLCWLAFLERDHSMGPWGQAGAMIDLNGVNEREIILLFSGCCLPVSDYYRCVIISSQEFSRASARLGSRTLSLNLQQLKFNVTVNFTGSSKSNLTCSANVFRCQTLSVLSHLIWTFHWFQSQFQSHTNVSPLLTSRPGLASHCATCLIIE